MAPGKIEISYPEFDHWLIVVMHTIEQDAVAIATTKSIIKAWCVQPQTLFINGCLRL